MVHAKNTPSNAHIKFSNFGLIFPGWIGTLTAASSSPRAISLSPLIKYSSPQLEVTSCHVTWNQPPLLLPFPPSVAHHLARVRQHPPLRASGSGWRLPEAFQTTGEGPLRGDGLWQHLFPAEQVSPHRHGVAWNKHNAPTHRKQTLLLDTNVQISLSRFPSQTHSCFSRHEYNSNFFSLCQ